MSRMPIKIRLIYLVVFTLLLVGLVPLVLTGWFLSERSARELRAVENRYQIQLVQEKARQIEMFGQRHTDVVRGLADALEMAGGTNVLSTPKAEDKLGSSLRDNHDILAIFVKPVTGESVSIFRQGIIARQDIELLANHALNESGTRRVYIAPQQKLASGESVLTMIAPVVVDDQAVAWVAAIVSLKDIARSIVNINSSTEKELWESGLPIVFAVNSQGEAIFHPDRTLVEAQRPLTDIKIVSEWLDSNKQIQSGLVPFQAEHDGVKYDMIGAYSTANLGPGTTFGVIAMQDERKALASVGEMRWQTWLISLAFAFLAMLVGSLAARRLTGPISRLSSVTEKIAGGDLTSRVDSNYVSEIDRLGDSFNVMSDRLQEHIARLAQAAKENRELFVGTVKALAAAIDGKDKYTRGHSERVSRISVAIGRQMSLPEDELETLRISALLHDVGKIAIDDNILKKPAALTDEEFAIMKTHPQRGYKIMSQIPAMEAFLPGMYMHHEMVNGKGYPQGLVDEQIPLQAKIVSVADTFDAMTIDRPYSKGMTLSEALERIKELVGIRYDRAVVDALIRGCNAGEIGNGVVRLMAKRAQEASPSNENEAPAERTLKSVG